MSEESFHPLVYFWIAFYKNGTCIPQFDVETGSVNSFQDIDQTKLDRFGLFPFNASLTIRANISAGFVIAREVAGLPHFVMKLQGNQRLIYVRRNFIHIFTYSHCDKCGYEWQWSPTTHKDGEQSEVGLLFHPNYIPQTWEGKNYPCAQCPKCGSFNAVVCPECKDTLISEVERPEKKDEHYFKCHKCNKEYPRYICQLEGFKRRLIYLMGHQTTVDGKNVKQIMFINEDGTFELSEDFNYK
jgi:hypothetical protein